MKPQGIFKKLKLKGKCSDNNGKNICRLFDILTQFPFTACERELDYYYQKVIRDTRSNTGISRLLAISAGQIFIKV